MDMQSSGGMADMVKAMAGLPEDKRRAMVRDRLETFAELGEDERQGAMGQMMQAVMGLAEEDKRAIVKTRTDVLCDLDEGTRMTLMGSHMALLQSLGPEAMMGELKTIESIVPQLTPEKQKAVQMMMEQMQGGGMTAMAGAGAGRGGHEPTGKPWWKLWG